MRDLKTDTKVGASPLIDETRGGAMARVPPGALRAPGLAADLTEDVSPGQLILAALDKGVSVDVIEKLVALKERIEDRNAVKDFIRDLAALKAELPTIMHTKKAAFTAGGGKVSYSYTEMDELAAAVQPYLSKYGFTTGWDQRYDGKLVTTICTLQHRQGHSRHSSFTLPAENNSAASPQQKIGMADTYASRRAFLAVLGLTTSDAEPLATEMDPTPITDDQLDVLDDMLERRNEGKTKEKAAAFTEKFLKYMDVDAIGKICAVDYEKAVAALRPPAKSEAAS